MAQMYYFIALIPGTHVYFELQYEINSLWEVMTHMPGQQAMLCDLNFLKIKQGRCQSTLFILETRKQVLWQTVKTQMKCHIRWHFIRVSTICLDKYNFQGQKYISSLKF